MTAAYKFLEYKNREISQKNKEKIAAFQTIDVKKTCLPGSHNILSL